MGRTSRIVSIVCAIGFSAGLLGASGTFAQGKKDPMANDDMVKKDDKMMKGNKMIKDDKKMKDDKMMMKKDDKMK